MKRYERYKPSGIEWIGEIPEHWEHLKLRWVTKFFYGESLKNEDRAEGDVPVFGSNGIVGYHSKAITEAPCLIIGRKGSYGKINYSESPCFPIDTTYFIDKKATKNSLRWLFYVLPVLKLDAYSKDSAVPGLSREEAYENILPLPTVDEQSAIANYLNRKTAQIDDLVAKKQKLIDLLNEERTAIINQAVTKGLNPNAPMKDSGIPWLGQIPAHWSLKKVKWFFQLSRGFDLPSNEFIEGKYPVYGSNGIIGFHNAFKAKGPGITVGRSGSVGEVNYVESDFWPHNTCLYVERNTGNDWKYIFYYLRTMDLKSLSSGTAVGTLNRNYIHEESVGFPSEDEQAAIVRHIEFHANQIDVAIARINKEIELLQEYHTALISEAVTGKIDVRI